MKAKLIQIGNSRGVRLPKPIIEQVGLLDEVELVVRDGAVVISAVQPARHGWADAAAALSARHEDTVLDLYAPNDFDAREWEW
ncbi:MAG: AbrB/MazE/SpoVT family DNA-binding domain-containing protein [Candidatus Bipolaricaulota bacterium]|nr:AbrB/MazE/SpoVT family DNA-binding domain-containing protein [Candidatus Bipolaricaulota bacterium]